MTQSGHRRARTDPSHHISHGAGADVGGGVGGELAVEFGKKQNAVGEGKPGAGGGERGVLCGVVPLTMKLAPGSVWNTAVEQVSRSQTRPRRPSAKPKL